MATKGGGTRAHAYMHACNKRVLTQAGFTYNLLRHQRSKGGGEKAMHADMHTYGVSFITSDLCIHLPQPPAMWQARERESNVCVYACMQRTCVESNRPLHTANCDLTITAFSYTLRYNCEIVLLPDFTNSVSPARNFHRVARGSTLPLRSPAAIRLSARRLVSSRFCCNVWCRIIPRVVRCRHLRSALALRTLMLSLTLLALRRCFTLGSLFRQRSTEPGKYQGWGPRQGG